MDETKLGWIEEMNDRERAALVNRLQLEMFRPVSEYEWPPNVEEVREEAEREVEFRRIETKIVRKPRQKIVRPPKAKKELPRLSPFVPQRPTRAYSMPFEKSSVTPQDARIRAAEAI